MSRILLWAVLFLLVARVIGRLVRGIAEGASGRVPSEGPRRSSHPSAPEPVKGEMMVRDPVCGTFVLPSRSLSARGSDGPVYFCSEKCRETHASH